MSFVTDDFISYNEELLVKQEKLSIDDDSIIGSSTSESTPPYPSSMNQALQNLLSSNDQSLTLEPFTYASLFSAPPKKQPFKIIRTQKPEVQKPATETFEVKIESEDKLVSRTKRIMKREKAKQRLRIKQEESPALSSVNSKYIPDGFDNPDLDGKSKRKMVQMIRNRISAQNSRDRKKAYMVQLEEAKSILADENNKLATEKSTLLKQLKKLEKTQRKLQQENHGLKKCWEENCTKCGKNKGFHAMEEEHEEEKDQNNTSTLSKIFDKFTQPIMNKLPEGQKAYNKKTMTLATIISIVMVMNLVQQSPTLLQGGAGKTKSAASSIGQVEKKILQQAIAANLSGDKTAQSLELVERIIPLMQKFGENHYGNNNNLQKEMAAEEEMQAPLGDLASFIKLEDFGEEANDIKPMDFLAAFKKRPDAFSLDDDDMLLNEDKKSQTSTYFSAHPFDYCNDEGKINLNDEQEQEINIKNFGLGKLQFIQNGIKRQFGGNDENKKIENNLLTSWSGVFGNNGFEYN
jgi:hypothetical protein